MDLFRQGMKGPTRPAPTVPGTRVNVYSPVTNWDNDPFGADVFEPTPNAHKKKPPPRPPPPRVRQPDIPTKPSHFIRKPTVLSSLLSRKPKTVQSANNQTIMQEFIEQDTHRMFPKCEPKNVQTGALIDLSSPPSSPTFTTRSSSDGLSVDSFGSDATTSTNHLNNHCGNASQAESGFEDDFDLFLTSRKMVKDDTLDNFAVDPFSPVNKPPIMKKPVISKDPFGSTSNVQALKGPTIIRAKPARPKPPDNSSILKTTFGNSFPVTPMTVNTTMPIQKVSNGFGDNFDSKPLSWESDSSPERESSPPMPSMPPPPPPEIVDDLPEPDSWPEDDVPGTNFTDPFTNFSEPVTNFTEPVTNFTEPGTNFAEPGTNFTKPVTIFTEPDEEPPHAISLFDYYTEHPDDLNFPANTKINLIRRVDDEWLYGSVRSGAQGLFPSNYVQIKVPLPNEIMASTPSLGKAVAMYDFEPDQPGDLRFVTGDTITVRHKLNDEWYFGECNGKRGQFPINYVQMS